MLSLEGLFSGTILKELHRVRLESVMVLHPLHLGLKAAVVAAMSGWRVV